MADHGDSAQLECPAGTGARRRRRAGRRPVDSRGQGQPRRLLLADAALRELPGADASRPTRCRARSSACNEPSRSRPADLLRARRSRSRTCRCRRRAPRCRCASTSSAALTLTTPLQPLPLPRRRPARRRCSATARSSTVPGPAQPRRRARAARRSATSRPTSACSCSPPVRRRRQRQRMFVPRVAYTALRDRPAHRRGAGRRRTARRRQQIEQAVDAQEELRTQKLGDILVTRQIVSPEQLLEAIERQAKMPMVRIGEALISLGMVTDAQLAGGAGAAAARPQRAAGRTAGAHGRGLARGPADRAGAQDGLPAGRRRHVPGRGRGAAQARHSRRACGCSVMPLLVRDGRLVVALDDPARRRAAVDEVEFSAADEGRAGAGAQPLDRGRAARGLRQDRLRPAASRDRSATPPIDARLRPGTTPTSWSRRSRRKAATRAERRRRPADRAVRQLAGAADQQHDHRGAQGGRLRHPHRELPGPREDPHPLPQGRRAAHLPRAAAELPQRADRAHQDHVRPRHLRAAQAAGRQDQLRQVLAAAQARAARGDDPDQQRPRRRGDAASWPRPSRSRSTGWASRTSNLERAEAGDRAALRHGAVRRPDRLGQDDHAALGAQPHQRARAQDLDRRGPGRNHPAGPAPGAGQPEDRLDLREGAARLPARRPGRDHGRRNPRRRDRADGDRSLADRPPGAVARCTPTARPRP